MADKWRTRTDGSPDQIGQHYRQRPGSYAYGARVRGSGVVIPPQPRSVDSFKRPSETAIKKEMAEHPQLSYSDAEMIASQHLSREKPETTATGKAYVNKFSTEELIQYREYFVSVVGKEVYENELTKRNKATSSIQETPDFQSGYDKGLQEAALGKYRPHKGKSENWKKGYDAGWRKQFKDPDYDEIVLINTQEDLTAWEKRRAVMESPEFQAWMAERWHTDPVPKDPYVAFMIDKSLKAKLKTRPDWARKVNAADWQPVDYPPITKEAPPDIAVPPPKTAEAEKSKRELRAWSKHLAHEMNVSEPVLHFTTSRGRRARSYYRSGFAVNRNTGELVKVAEPEIVIGIPSSGELSAEQYGVLAHEMGHHKQVYDIKMQKGDHAVVEHYNLLRRDRAFLIEGEREAWRNADPYLKGKRRPPQKWLKKWALGTYLGTVPGFREKSRTVVLTVPQGMEKNTVVREKKSKKNPFVLSVGGEKKRIEFAIGRKGASATYKKGNEETEDENEE